MSLPRINVLWFLDIKVGNTFFNLFAIIFYANLWNTLHRLIDLNSLTIYELFTLGINAMYVNFKERSKCPLFRKFRITWHTFHPHCASDFDKSMHQDHLGVKILVEPYALELLQLLLL